MTLTSFSGAASNPLVPLATLAPITWNVPLTLTEPSPTDLNISGTLNVTCYPAHEVSMGGYDLSGGTWMPQSNSLYYIITCLGTAPLVQQKINADIPLIPPQPLQ
jgi:hypothetical protein